jgi:hypothetical protein
VDRLLAEIAAEKARKWGFDFAQRKSPSLPYFDLVFLFVGNTKISGEPSSVFQCVYPGKL